MKAEAEKAAEDMRGAHEEESEGEEVDDSELQVKEEEEAEREGRVAGAEAAEAKHRRTVLDGASCVRSDDALVK